MDGDHGQATGYQNAAPFGEHRIKEGGRTVDEAVERDDAAHTLRRHRQAGQIGPHEGHLRCVDPRLAQLASRGVRRQHRHAVPGEERGDMSGTGADLEHGRAAAEAVGHPAEERPVERLAVELVGVLGAVARRDLVEERRHALGFGAELVAHPVTQACPYLVSQEPGTTVT